MLAYGQPSSAWRWTLSSVSPPDQVHPSDLFLQGTTVSFIRCCSSSSTANLKPGVWQSRQHCSESSTVPSIFCHSYRHGVQTFFLQHFVTSGSLISSSHSSQTNPIGTEGVRCTLRDLTCGLDWHLGMIGCDLGRPVLIVAILNREWQGNHNKHCGASLHSM